MTRFEDELAPQGNRAWSITVPLARTVLGARVRVHSHGVQQSAEHEVTSVEPRTSCFLWVQTYPRLAAMSGPS